MNKESAAAEIARIYRTQRAAGEWMSMINLGEQTDMTPDEIADGMRHLSRTEERFNLAPESNQRMLTEMDRIYAVRQGGQDLHLFCWF